MIEPKDAIARTWVQGLRARSTKTAIAYADAVNRFLEYVAKPVTEITVQDALAYVGSLADSGLARASVAHHISAIRSFLRHCQGLGLIPSTPLDALKRPRVVITSMNRYLTRDEAERLLSAAKGISPQAHLAVAMMLLTGLRVSELAQAEWRHVFKDPQGNIGLLVHGKGGKERVVAIRDDLWELVSKDRRRRGLTDSLDARDRSPLVADRQGTPYSAVGLWKVVKKATRAAGIEKDVSPHWLRHSFGTLAALGGANVFQIQAAMGHAQITTSQRYIHWARGLADSAVHRVDLRLDTTEGQGRQVMRRKRI